MNNGRKSLNFCAHAQTSTLERRTIAGATSRPSCGWHEVVLLGDCCLSTTVTGTAYISASHAGVKRVYGNECISILCKTPIWSMSSLIALWCGSRSSLCCWSLQKNGGQSAQALGRSRGGFSTKIHVSVDGLGNPLRFELTAGQRHDITQAQALIADFETEHVIADKGYDSMDFLQCILGRGALPVIPPRSNRKTPREYDEYLYRERHLVECFINKIKHYRHIFSRFDKLSSRFLGFLNFVGALIWLR